MKPIEGQESLLQDYDVAVMTILWCIHQNKRKLIFSMIEAFPKECVDFHEIDEQTIQVKVGLSKPYPRMFYRRVRMTMKEALELYRACDEGGFEMIWDKEPSKDGSPKRIISSHMRQMPEWPLLTLSQNIETEMSPFLAKTWGVCRVHHLLSEEPDAFVMQLVAHEKSVAWMQDRLLWDIHEYPELVGSMHLILPNPVYRYLEEKMIPSENGAPEHVRINLMPRKGQLLNSLQLITVERTSFGILNFKTHKVCNPAMEISLAGKAEEFATAVYCKQRGLLDYTKFAGFLRGISIDMGIVQAIREVNLPGSTEFYQVPIVETEELHIGNPLEEQSIDLGDKLALRLWKKRKKKTAEELNQRLFLNGESKEAENFIGGIIQHARKRVVIVDPYFATMELYRYVFRVTSKETEIAIITSAEVLNDKNEFAVNDDGMVLKKGQVLFREIRAHAEKISENPISVFVMTGTPLIHDRFLVIDDEVWFSGNSLNHIGERASMMIRLPEADEVLGLVENVRNNTERVKSLEEWVENCEMGGETGGK